MLRQIEKENSPIRAYLNQKQHGDDEGFNIRELDIEPDGPENAIRDFGLTYEPQIIEVSQMSSIFDKDRFEHRSALQDL